MSTRKKLPSHQTHKKKTNDVYNKILKVFRYPRLVIYAFIIIWVIIIWLSVPVPILNPQNTPTPYTWTLTYPDSPPNNLYFTNTNTTLYIQMKISASQPFADSTDIHLNAMGSMGTDIAKNVSDVTIGFLDAYPYGLSQNEFSSGSPLAGVKLQPNATYIEQLPLLV